MKKILLLCLTLLTPLLAQQALAQDEEFDMSAFEPMDDAKMFCNNKVNGLSPTKLLSISFDWMGANTWESTPGDAFPEGMGEGSENSNFARNSGLRIETNYPIISNNSLIVNAYVNYWESRYALDGNESPVVGGLLEDSPLRTSVLGALIFKPLDEKHFMIFQVEGALNGNYNFSDISPDFGKTKFSGAVLYGWKTNDNTNVAVGVTRTYRGGRALHIPILMLNKTFNKKWGVEMLLPARGALRRNFSAKSIVTLGYELEGQSYHLQGRDGQSLSPMFGATGMDNDWELRKSEIRARLSWDKSISDFIWFNVQAGAMVPYRMDIDQMASTNDSWVNNSPGIPFYFRVGLQMVSP